MLEPNTHAPNFSLKDQNGQIHKLSDYLGRWVILYFYPRDNTPGCTTEACAFRDHFDVLRKMGIEIIGVSKDSITSHQNFTDRFSLPFTLLSDPERKIIQSYGAWREKTFAGKTFMGTHRMTFIINPKGVISKIFENVNPSTHVQEIIAHFNSLK